MVAVSVKIESQMAVTEFTDNKSENPTYLNVAGNL